MAQTTDPYGIDVAIDATGDLRVTHSGSLALVAGPYNCAQAMFLRLQTPRGDLPLHPDYGSAIAGRLIGAKQDPAGLMRQLQAELQAVPGEDPRFREAAVIGMQNPANTGQPGSIQFDAQATLVGGEQLVLNSGDPSPSDVTLTQFADPAIDPTLELDPTLEQEFFADSDTELDALNDLNTVDALVNDIPTTSILATGE